MVKNELVRNPHLVSWWWNGIQFQKKNGECWRREPTRKYDEWDWRAENRLEPLGTRRKNLCQYHQERNVRYASKNNRSNVTKRSAAMVFKGNGIKDNIVQCYGENIDKQQFLKTITMLAWIEPSPICRTPYSCVNWLFEIWDRSPSASQEPDKRRIQREHAEENDVGNLEEDILH